MCMQKTIVKTISNIVAINLMSLKTDKPISQRVKKTDIIKLAELFEDKQINNQGLQKTLEILLDEPNSDVVEIVIRENFLQNNDEDFLGEVVAQVILASPKQIEQYKSGKTNILGYFVGQCMKMSKGQGNPQKFGELVTIAINNI